MANEVLVNRAHAFAVYQDGAAIADAVKIDRVHAFAVYQNANADLVANSVTLRRAHAFAVIRQVPQFSVDGTVLKVEPAHAGSHSVTVRATDDNGNHIDEVFNVTVTDT
jgi:hypothetical protein